MSLDWQGYYQRLGLTPGADDNEIKTAFRQKAKKLHPDQNPGRDTTADFQSVNQAYEILRDPVKRRDYDEEGLKRLRTPRQTGTSPDIADRKTSSSPSNRTTTNAPYGVNVHVCSSCHCLSAQLRVVSFYKVYGLVIRTKRVRETAILCPRCALKRGFRVNLGNWIFGWWGFPSGPFRVIESSFINMRGGQIRRGETASLLLQQAQAFIQAGQPKLAAGLFQDALFFAPDRHWRAHIQTLRQAALGPSPVVRLKNQWHFFGQNVYMIQLAFNSLVCFWLIMLVGSFFNWFGLFSNLDNILHQTGRF